MRWPFLATILAVWTVGSASAGTPFDALRKEADSPPTNHVISPVASMPPTIDGEVNDPCWQKAGRVSGFLRIKSETKAAQQTAVYATHDRNALYVAFVVADSAIAAVERERDKMTWVDDCVEIMLDPLRQRQSRFHIIVTAAGMVYDARSGKASWNGALKVATRRYPGQGWTAEIALPFKTLEATTPFRGLVWDIKLCREDYAVLAGAAREMSCWQFVANSFGGRGGFGRLVFEGTNVSVNGDFSARIDKGWIGSRWRMSAGKPKATASFTVVENAGHTAPPSGRVVFGQYAQVQHLSAAAPRRKYRLSVWINMDELAGKRALSFATERYNKVHADPKAKGWQKLTTYAVSGDVKWLAMTLTSHGSRGAFLVDDVEVVEVANVPRGPRSICYTGNAKGAQARHNRRVAGRYAYHDLGTRSPWPPEKSVSTGWPDVKDMPGWIGFEEGKLTDGKASYVRWANYAKKPGKTVIFDLGADAYVTDVLVEPVERRMLDLRVYLRQDGVERSTLAAWRGRGKSIGLTQVAGLNAVARYVRIDHNGPCGLREIQIWGEPKAKPAAPRPFTLPVKAGVRPRGGAVVAEGFGIFPTPKSMALDGGVVPLPQKVVIGLPERASEEMRFIAEDLAGLIRRKTNREPSIGPGAEKGFINLVVRTGDKGKEDKGEEGYRLTVTDDGARIVAGGLNGLFYGCQSLSQCLVSSDKGPALRRIRVRDWPSFPFRVVQFWSKHMREHRHGMVGLTRLRWNMLSDASRQPGDLRFIRKLAKYRMECLVKCAAIPAGGWYGRYPECVELNPGEKITDLPNRMRIMPCPSNPKTMELLKKEIEVASRYPGRYAWINVDECYQERNGARWNVCKRCRARNMSGGDLFYDYMMKIYNGLAKVGKKPAMIDLMLCHVKYKGIHKGFARFPRDIPLADWQKHHLAAQKHGFKTFEYFISGYRWTADRPVRPDLGALYSADWYGWTPGLLVFWAERLWDYGPKDKDPRSPEMLTQIDRGLALLRDEVERIPLPSRAASREAFHPIPLASAANCSLSDVKAGDGDGLYDVGAGRDMAFLRRHMELGGVPFRVGGQGGRDIVVIENRGILEPRFKTEIRIPVARKAAGLVFLHALTELLARNYATKITYAGNYIMEYADGTRVAMPVKWNENIRVLFEKYNPDTGPALVSRGRLAYQGVTASGEDIYLISAEWVNPFPAKEIRAVILRSPARMLNSRVALFALTAVDVRPEDERFWAGRKVTPLHPARQSDVPPGVTEMQLGRGKFVSDTDYRAPDGTTVTAESTFFIHAKNSVFRARQRVGYVTTDTNFGWVVKDMKPQSLVVTFPESRNVAGVAYMGFPEHPYHAFSDRSTPIDVRVDVSADGVNWATVANETGHVSDRDLESRRFFEPTPARKVRFTVSPTGRKGCQVRGLARIRVYTRDQHR